MGSLLVMGNLVNTEVLGLTADIIAAHVGYNDVAVDALPGLIQSVYRALANATVADAVLEEAPRPAVPVKRSVFPDYIVCLEDGKKLKMLKRHLKTSYKLSPADYRAKWGLPPDYPMIAPNYASVRSTLAKSIGLGQKRPDAESEPYRTVPTEPELERTEPEQAAAEPGVSERADAEQPNIDTKVIVGKARRARGSRG